MTADNRDKEMLMPDETKVTAASDDGANRMESWLKHEIGYVPPSSEETVIVNGRAVPHVTATHLPNGRLCISVGIHTFECDIFDGEAILGLVADAVAVGAGFVSWPQADDEFVSRPFAAKWFMVTGVTTDGDAG